MMFMVTTIAIALVGYFWLKSRWQRKREDTAARMARVA